MRNISILFVATSVALLSLGSAPAQDAAPPILRSIPSPTPEATATKEPSPKPEGEFETPSAEIRTVEPMAAKAPKAEVKTKALAAPPREDAVGGRRSTLNVEPVRAIESRKPLDQQEPDQPLSRPRALRPISDIPAGSRAPVLTIRSLEESWQAAIKNHDVAALDKLLADDLEATSSTGAKGGKATLLRALRNDKSVYKSVRAQGMSVKDAGPDTAVVTGVTTETGTTADGKPFKISRRFTDTWKQREGKWECVASEATQ